MDSFLAYCSYCCILILGTDGVTLTFEIKSNMPLKGSSLEFSCMLERFNSDIILILIETSEVTRCHAYNYLCSFKDSYSFTVNTTGVYGVISNLTTEATGTWSCRYIKTTTVLAYSNTWNVIVYTIPSELSITQNPDQNVDLSEKSIVLQCKTVGCTFPIPTLKWIFKDQASSQEYVFPTPSPTQIQESCPGQERMYTSTLNLPQYTTLADNSDKTGTFKCRVEYPDPSKSIISSSPRTVTFSVNVTNITLDKPRDMITILNGTKTSLKCTAGPSRPKPDIRWWLNGTEVTNLSITTVTGGNLFIASSELQLIIDRSHQGKTVYCDARVAGQVNAIASVKPVINVWYQPSVPSVQAVQGNNFPWLENQTGTLQCVMEDPGNPNASVKWTSSWGTADMAGNLVFTNLSATDHGQPVYCQVQNNFTDIKSLTVLSPTISLNVEYRPTITLNPSVQPLRIKEGNTLTVICLASGNPLPMVQWKNRNPPSNALIIPNILRNNTGSYTCLARNTSTNYNHVVLQREESMTVIVEYAPDVRVSITGSTVVGFTAVLMCTAQGEPPQYTFHPWIHRAGQTDIRSLNGVDTSTTSILTLSNFSIQDMGSYICTVNNSITGPDGQLYQMGNTSVNVLGPPAFGETNSKITGEVGKPKTIEIPFYSSSSKTTVKFIKQLDSFVISNTSDVSIYISTSNVTLTFYTKKEIILGHVAVLFFGNVTDRDFDNYTLQLSNDMGNVTMVFDFTAPGPPSRPHNFFFINIKDGFLLFGIEKGHNGGHDQTFVVEYRPSGNSESNWSSLLKINETNLEQSSTDGVYHIKIPKLQDGMYTFRVYAENVKGTSSAFENVYADIKAEQPPGPTGFQVGAVVGGVVGGILLVVVIVVAIVFMRRCKLNPKMKAYERKEESTDHFRSPQLGPLYANTSYGGDVRDTAYESLQAKSTIDSPYQTIDKDPNNGGSEPLAIRSQGSDRIYMNTAIDSACRDKEYEGLQLTQIDSHLYSQLSGKNKSTQM